MIISVVITDPIFVWIVASVAAAAAVDPNGIKSLLAYGSSTFFIKQKPVSSNCSKPQNLWLINNNFCGKLLSSLELPKTFDESFKVTSGPFFIPDFNWLACKNRQYYIWSVKLSHFILIFY